jgi:hypothetical protein
MLPTTRWPEIEKRAIDVVDAVNSMQPGEYRQLRWRYRS